MAITSEEQSIGSPMDSYPLLRERQENRENQHVIDIERGSDASSSTSFDDDGSPHERYTDDRSTHNATISIAHNTSASNGANSRSPVRGGEGLGRRRWSPFNTLLWISAELLFTTGQIIAAIIVLSMSHHENPQTPLFAWIVGYAAGCAASLPLLYWRYLHRNQDSEQRSAQTRQVSSQANSAPESNSYITISFARSSEEENRQNTSQESWNAISVGGLNPRLNMLMDQFKMALDCFFAVWFVVGNVWIFGGHTSSADAPNLYRLCIVFLTFSCIGYAMPFILCGMICCCLPCIISILGVREDMNQMRGASEDSINALPTHKFKLKRNGTSDSIESNSGLEEGGVVAAGTEKERAISGEDAVCCICLARYTDNDLLRELPCSHFFHTACVDKWLKINASCPLCKYEIGGSNENASDTADANQQA